MKRNLTFCFVSVFTLTLLSCTRNTSARLENTITLDFETLVDAKLSEVFKAVHYSKLDLPDHLYIGVVDKAIFDGGKLFLFDFLKTQTLFIFTEDGQFLNSIHKPGRGPSEYLRPTDFIINGNEIEILDVTNKILVYNTDGEFVKEVKLPFNTDRFSKIENGQYLFYTKGSANTQYGNSTECELMLININNGNTRCLLSKDDSQYVPQFHQKNIINESSERTLFSKVFSDTIYSVSKNAVNVEYVIDFGSHALDKERIDTRKVGFDIILETLNSKPSRAYHNPELYEDEHFLITRYRYGKLNYAIFDRKSKSFKRLRSGETNDIDSGLPFYSMNALWKNQAVAFIDPNLFLDIYYANQPDPSKKVNQELLDFCKGLDINDPPIMVRYVFR